MGFIDLIKEFFGFKKKDSVKEYMEKAEKIEPEAPLNYKNDTDDLAGVTSEGADL